MAFRSKRPYLIRALNDWIVDSDLTPYLMVDATGESVAVPEEFVSDGRIVLNISPSAVRDLLLADEAISFSARFGGRPFAVYVPVEQVLAIYAQETNEGMMFDPETQPASESDPQSLKAAAPALAAVPVDGGSAAQKEPSAAQKEPSAAGKEPSAAQKEPSAAQKEPSAAQKEPSAAQKEPSTTPKESDPEAKPGGHLKLID